MKRYLALLWILILMLSTSQARSAGSPAADHPVAVAASQPRLVVWFGYLRLT